jgi:hypothetical protein
MWDWLSVYIPLYWIYVVKFEVETTKQLSFVLT